jgi:hypothetical protein
MPLFRFDYEIRYYHKDNPAKDTIYGEGFTLVEAESPEEANKKNDTLLQTVDPRIEWDDNVADWQQLDDDGYEYEDFSFDTKDGPTLVDPEDYDEETLDRHKKAWADSTPNGAGLKHPC